jgi:hypothetical protein
MTTINPLGFFKVRAEITTRHSGKLVFVLDSISVEKSANAITGMDFKGRDIPQYIRLDEIVGIRWRQVGFWGLFA